MLVHHPSVSSRLAYLKQLVGQAEDDVRRGEIYHDALKRMQPIIDELINFDKSKSQEPQLVA